MKVILLHDVANLGRKLEVVEVPDGYALNKLIPKGLAQIATPENVRRLTTARNKKLADRSLRNDEFKAAIASLKDTKLSIPAKVNENGHMFESLKSPQVAAALAAKGVSIAANQFVIKETIKHSGEHTITLVYGDVEAQLPITIISE